MFQNMLAKDTENEDLWRKNRFNSPKNVEEKAFNSAFKAVNSASPQDIRSSGSFLISPPTMASRLHESPDVKQFKN